MTVRRLQRGFTLVEIVVTLAVLALIMFAVAPNIGTWLANTRVRNIADSLQNGLQTARAEAIRRNQSMSFWLVQTDDPGVLGNECTLASNSGSWVVSVNSPVAHCADQPSTTSSPMLVAGRAMGNGQPVTVAALQSDKTTAANSITFHGFGRVSSTSPIGFIDVSGTGTRNLRIEISTAGAVRLCDPAVSSENDPRKCL
mgnify:CR=1 FL=1